jgi:DNA-binding NarL/FixJ family response regulator
MPAGSCGGGSLSIHHNFAMTALLSAPRASTPISNPIAAVKTRIFLVDDHPLIRNALAQLLSAEPDFVVCGEAGNTVTAFSQIVKLNPDIVIVDLGINGNSGLTLIKSIQSFNPKIGLIVMTMHAESVYGLRSLRAGAQGFVSKSDPPGKVIEAIRQIRAGHVFASPMLTTQVLSGIQQGHTLEGLASMNDLTDRELEIVALIGRGNTTNEIATQLHVSVKTIETHRGHIKEKLQLAGGQLVHFCVRWVRENEALGGADAAAPGDPEPPPPENEQGGGRRPGARRG